MKVLLVAVNSKFIHSNLAVRYLKAFTKDIEYNCKVREFSINDIVDKVLQEIINEKPNLVAFSCYIWNIEYIKMLANLIKCVDENIEILYGGPEVSYDCKEFLINNPGEFLIEGEGEKTYREFIQLKLLKKDFTEVNIKGLYTKTENGVFYSGKREYMDMNELVFPYEENDKLDNKIVYYEASRGCPFNCKYCLSSTFHGVRFLNIERVKKELKYFINKKVKLVKFVDRTFNCNPKFAMEIWSFLINEETNTTFHFEISADILTKEEIKILAKAPLNRFQFEIGVQTTNNKVLKNINRYVNFEDIKEKVEELQKIKNIKQHLDLIAGLPEEDFKSFKKSFNDVYSIYPEEIQLGFLKLLKGSDMREEASKWGMVYSPYPPYEILKTNHISYEELVKLKRVEMVLDKYYNSGKFRNILKYFIIKFKTPFDFYYEMGSFLYYKGYLNRNISAADYYKVFIEFNEEVLKENSILLKEIIKFDYLKYNKKKWLPPFLDRYVDKDKEKEIKSKIKKGEICNFDKFHIEKFNINIIKYVSLGIIEKGNFYVIFDEKDRNGIVSI
ncbi:oxygen-independent coproporphyrinogen-III oxidase-like protein HemZ [Clostridium acetireducens DSM 10703]|jgi:radical SAM superfamily enzyme YgiQ (UPF0313 family)|uniref:Oxygen-independent coproporphyrinogen-III oxidase-like protein HemZ n=1 Tax=Clostridium acetireducens DSM 10703 TaxID=1121290 RepID=A0A1E8EYG3_9CLOT|nr:B12-binding domain-containing radical SAM protein [Clostridium acetireducens]OFI05590.1 oxygen-independent coproporphyrinogen-III oxidase-like protein HemZ [Clostridium acetireducens DSM 10703]